jgi:hypothetical protein
MLEVSHRSTTVANSALFYTSGSGNGATMHGNRDNQALAQS